MAQTVPEREWVVQDRVPLRNVTLLSGEGGVGKSFLLAPRRGGVLGRDWLSALPTPGPAIVVCCEDDVDELHRRLDLIAEHYSATGRNLQRAEGHTFVVARRPGRGARCAEP